MSIASTIAGSGTTLQNGLHVVTTGGGVILDETVGNIVVPKNVELTCGGNNTGTADNDDYRIFDKNGKPVLTNAIVLDLRDSIELSQENAAFTHCNLVAGVTGGGSDGTAANPYSPSVYYPNCQDTAVPCTEYSGPNLRSAINEYSAFNPNPTALYGTAGSAPASASIGITLTTAENLRVQDVTVLGFGTCYRSDAVSSKSGRRLIIDRLYGDCDTGISVNHSPDETHFNSFVITPLLTRNNGANSVEVFNVKALAAGSGSPNRYKATVQVDTTGTDPYHFKNGDTVWIATDSSTGAQSAAGRWTVANVTSSGPCPAPYSSLQCQSFALAASNLASATGQDSRFSSPTLHMATSHAVVGDTTGGVPLNAITNIATQPSDPDQLTLRLVAVGQTVAGTCIPDGTTVTDVWPAKGVVYMSASATCTHIGAVNFNDTGFTTPTGDCGGSPNPGCAIVSATARMGDGIVVMTSGGVTAVNCQTYEHLTAFHCSSGAASSRFANCATGENIGLPDQDVVGVRIDGSHSTAEGYPPDACGTEFVNGILGQHRTVAIVVQSNCTDPNHFTNVRGAVHTGGRRNAIGVEMDAGALTLTNSDAFGPQNVFKADKTTLYDSGGAGADTTATLSIGNDSFPGSTLYLYDTDAATNPNSLTLGCGNTFANSTAYKCSP